MTTTPEETAVTEQVELKPCAHCSGKAEIDTMQGFISLSSKLLENRCAVYCLNCGLEVSVCYSDVPEMSDDEVIEHVSDIWNLRPAPDPAKDVEGLVGEMRAYIPDPKCSGNAAVLLRKGADALQSTAAQSQLIGEISKFMAHLETDIAAGHVVLDGETEKAYRACGEVTAWREGK